MQKFVSLLVQYYHGQNECTQQLQPRLVKYDLKMAAAHPLYFVRDCTAMLRSMFRLYSLSEPQQAAPPYPPTDLAELGFLRLPWAHKVLQNSLEVYSWGIKRPKEHTERCIGEFHAYMKGGIETVMEMPDMALNKNDWRKCNLKNISGPIFGNKKN